MLFVSHNASRSGAPLLLLEFERWLVANTAAQVSTALLDGGPLAGRFGEVGPVLGPDDLATAEADLVYLNTVGSAAALHRLAPGPRVVCHVHELDYALAHWITEGDREALRRRVDRFVVVSDLVRDALVRGVGVDPARIVRHYGFIDVPAVRAAAGDHHDRHHDHAAPLVGTSGTTEWRKAPDLFVALAGTVRRARPDATFCWVGGSATGPEIDQVLADRARAGLDEAVAFVGEQPDAVRWFAGYDVFALLSRDDPFPLTCLECAALEVPVVAFDSTGAREFLADGCGVVVPYPDVEAMAGAVVDLLGDPERRAALVERAARRVEAEHDLAVAAPRLFAELQSVLAA